MVVDAGLLPGDAPGELLLVEVVAPLPPEVDFAGGELDEFDEGFGGWMSRRAPSFTTWASAFAMVRRSVAFTVA